MKITDPDVIKNGEKNLIEAVKDDIDLAAVKEILKKKMAATALSYKRGEIVVYNNKIAFRLDFETHLSGSFMFDRQGNYIPESDQTGDQKSENNEIEMDDLIRDDIVDDDINDILKESREFWELKKES
ncbi:hypothetical protein [Desulfobacula sp.]|uniref:hypothetical protein n=1 Tax=Desulfobacula sp. TaxID=2593537 RepID=UPI0025B8229F|nr:hypothetical protein [Desulfobacula sp.]MBC2703895.1 hypothetical protein [Desulfobacula sp.]